MVTGTTETSTRRPALLRHEPHVFLDEPEIMSPDAVAEEIAAMRAERSAQNPR